MKNAGMKILSGVKSYREVLNPKKNDNTGKNIVVSAAILKRLLFVPRSTLVERGTNKSRTKADGFGVPKKGQNFSA